jgi:hypothetical protein
MRPQTTIGFLLWCVAAAILGVVLASIPDQWDRATVLRVCPDGTPVLRLQDNSIWMRRGYRAYRVDNLETVC